MRQFLATALAISMAAAGVPSVMAAAQPEAGSLKGTAYQTNLQPLSKARVQLRSIRTATVVHSTTAGETGEFSFDQLQPDTYVVEIVDATGRVTGTSAPTTVVPASALNVSVTASAAGTVTTAQSAGFSILGLGQTTSLAVLGAAGATAITAVVATRPDASPSK